MHRIVMTNEVASSTSSSLSWAACWGSRVTLHKVFKTLPSRQVSIIPRCRVRTLMTPGTWHGPTPKHPYGQCLDAERANLIWSTAPQPSISFGMEEGLFS
eukprot:5695099-Amphidinium_carterae.2